MKRARKRGYLRRRGANSWEVRIDLGRSAGGKRQRRSCAVRGDHDEAQRRLTALLRETDEGVSVAPHRLTVGPFLDEWLTHMEPRVRHKTHRRYAEICRGHLIPALGHVLLRKLEAWMIEDAHAIALKSGRLDGKGGLAARTVRHHHRVLRDALNWAVARKLLPANPTNIMKHPHAESPEIRTLDDDEIGTLLHAAKGTRLYLPIMLTVTTGLRRSELLALRWQDLDCSMLRVRRTVEQSRAGVHFNPPKTKKGKRAIALPPVTVEALRAHRLEQKRLRLLLGRAYEDAGLIVCQPHGRLWLPDNFTSAYRRLVASTKLGALGFHALRHTHATQLLRQGIHPKIVSERLGHASVSITLDVYSHVIPGMQEDAAAKIDAAMRRSLKT
jgi:integrase